MKKGSYFFGCFITACIFLFGITCLSYAEQWTISFKSHLSLSQGGAYGQAKIDVRGQGSAKVSIDDSGKLSGQGTMNISENVAAGGMNIKARGAGPFQVTGRKDGDYIVFRFSGSPITVKGTMMGMPYDNSYEPSIFAPVDTAIERKEGATTHSKSSLSGLNGTTTYTISGGMGVTKEAPPPKGTFPDKENIWTLEVEGTWTQTVYNGTATTTVSGHAEFPLPKEDGPAKGEGPFTMNTSTSPYAKGKLLLDGKIKNDILTFAPRSTFDKSTVKGSGATVQSDFGTGIWAFDTKGKEISIPVKDGAEVKEEFSQPDSGAMGYIIWRLKGKKIEKWRIMIDDYHPNFLIDTGGGPRGKLAGLKVHGRRTVDVVIENNKFKSGTGTGKLITVDPYSYPSWAYEIKSLKKSAPGGRTTPCMIPDKFSVKGQKSGRRLSITLPEKSGWMVYIWCRVRFDEIKKHGYTISIQDQLYEKGPRGDSDWWSIMGHFNVVLKDGWAHETAPAGAEDRTTLTVKKLK